MVSWGKLQQRVGMFHGAVGPTYERVSYDKFNEHYEQQRVVLKENIDAKKALIEKLVAVNETLVNVSFAKEWDQKTKDVLGLQEAWKKIGFGSRKENELVYQEFRKQCDVFFQAKKEFSKDIESKFKDVADKKRKLIEEAKALSHSQEWKSTSEKLIQLQKSGVPAEYLTLLARYYLASLCFLLFLFDFSLDTAP
jgi:hypothetical protein